jgi:hypothetical protein
MPSTFWECRNCGTDLTQSGIHDYQKTYSTSDMSYDPDSGTWDYTGDSETYYETSDHVSYDCRHCGSPITPEQMAAFRHVTETE